LLTGCVLAAALASHLLPAGEYERRTDPATGRSVVVAGTYHPVPPRPVGPLRALVAIPRGMADAAAVIFFVFLIGGAFTVVDETGALRQGVEWLVRRVGHSQALVISAAALAFGLGGVLENMKEEIIALVPVMLLLTRRLGVKPVAAVAMSLGAAAVGAAFSPINPFQVGIAQQLAQLPLLSGSGSGERCATRLARANPGAQGTRSQGPSIRGAGACGCSCSCSSPSRRWCWACSATAGASTRWPRCSSSWALPRDWWAGWA
jgi:uncharacterized ion transporter superfamily protein YfcC